MRPIVIVRPRWQRAYDPTIVVVRPDRQHSPYPVAIIIIIIVVIGARHDNMTSRHTYFT